MGSIQGQSYARGRVYTILGIDLVLIYHIWLMYYKDTIDREKHFICIHNTQTLGIYDTV